jgi:hypothetical protein
MSVKGKVLTVTVDLSKNYGPSTTGKTEILATTEGNVSCPGLEDVNGRIGINVYKPV